MSYRKDLFSHTLNQLRAGKAQDELSESLNQVINACRETGKKGEIVLKIKVTPDKAIEGAYLFSDEITTKAPKHDKPDTTLWGTPEGNLQNHDPDQAEMDFSGLGPGKVSLA